MLRKQFPPLLLHLTTGHVSNLSFGHQNNTLKEALLNSVYGCPLWLTSNVSEILTAIKTTSFFSPDKQN